jgi:hypothetical protein
MGGSTNGVVQGTIIVHAFLTRSLLISLIDVKSACESSA